MADFFKIYKYDGGNTIWLDPRTDTIGPNDIPSKVNYVKFSDWRKVSPASADWRTGVKIYGGGIIKTGDDPDEYGYKYKYVKIAVEKDDVVHVKTFLANRASITLFDRNFEHFDADGRLDFVDGWHDVICVAGEREGHEGDLNWAATNESGVYEKTFTINSTNVVLAVSLAYNDEEQYNVDIEIKSENSSSEHITIKPSAFKNRTNLISLEITTSSIVRSYLDIGKHAFERCVNLTSIGGSLPYNISQYAFYDCRNLKKADIRHISEVGDYAFYNCQSLQTVSNTYTDYATTSGRYNQYTTTGCVFTHVGNYAFYNCLKAFNGHLICPYLRSVGDYAFFKCQNITYLALNGNNLEIGKYAFSGCSLLYWVFPITDWPESNTERFYFNNYFLKQINGLTNTYASDLPAFPLNFVPEGLFKECASLRHVNFSNAVSVDAHAFENCGVLSETCLSANCRVFGDFSLKYCGQISLWETVNRQIVTGLGKYTLAALNSSAGSDTGFNIDFPNLNYIGEHAVDGRTISEIQLTSNQLTVCGYAFAGMKFTGNEINVVSAAYIRQNAFSGADYNQAVINISCAQNIDECAFDGAGDIDEIIYIHTAATLPDYLFQGVSANKICNLSNITAIGEYTFSNASVNEIDLPKCVDISDNSFKNSSIRKISINSCKQINEYAFANSAALEELHISACETIRPNAFRNCGKLSSIYAESCLEIGSDAFNGCGRLIQLEIPRCEFIGVDALTDTQITAPSGMRRIYMRSNKKVFLGDSSQIIDCTQTEFINRKFVGEKIPDLSQSKYTYAVLDGYWNFIGNNSFTDVPNMRRLTIPDMADDNQHEFAIAKHAFSGKKFKIYFSGRTVDEISNIAGYPFDTDARLIEGVDGLCTAGVVVSRRGSIKMGENAQRKSVRYAEEPAEMISQLTEAELPEYDYKRTAEYINNLDTDIYIKPPIKILDLRTTGRKLTREIVDEKLVQISVSRKIPEANQALVQYSDLFYIDDNNNRIVIYNSVMQIVNENLTDDGNEYQVGDYIFKRKVYDDELMTAIYGPSLNDSCWICDNGIDESVFNIITDINSLPANNIFYLEGFFGTYYICANSMAEYNEDLSNLVVIMDQDVEEIDDGALSGLPGMFRVYNCEYASNLSSIGEAAFAGCCNLDYLRFDGVIEYIGQNAFGWSFQRNRIPRVDMYNTSEFRLNLMDSYPFGLYADSSKLSARLHGSRYVKVQSWGEIEQDELVTKTIYSPNVILENHRNSLVTMDAETLSSTEVVVGNIHTLQVKNMAGNNFNVYNTMQSQLTALYMLDSNYIPGGILRENRICRLVKADYAYRIGSPNNWFGAFEGASFNYSVISDLVLRAEYIGDKSFKNSQIRINRLSSQNLTAIGSEAFAGCRELKNAYLPNLISAGQNAFNECAFLENIETQSLTSMPEGMMAACCSLTGIYTPNCRRIEALALSECVKLTDFICEKTKYIGDSAFAGCQRLTSISCSAVEEISRFIFKDCGIQRINLKNLKTVSPYAFLESNVTSAYVDNQTLKSDSSGEFVTTSDGTCVMAVLPSLTGISDDSITAVVPSAFVQSNVKDVQLNHINEIPAYAFTDSAALSSASFGECSAIGVGAFKNCVNMTEISIPNVKTVESEAFRACRTLPTVGENAIETVNMNAFYGCELGKLDLPCIKNIETSAFNQCGIDDFTYNAGTLESIHSTAFAGASVLSVSATDETADSKYVTSLDGRKYPYIIGKHADGLTLELAGLPIDHAENGDGIYEIPKGVTYIRAHVMETICYQAKIISISEITDVVIDMIRYMPSQFTIRYTGSDSAVQIILDGHGLLVNGELVWCNCSNISDNRIMKICSYAVRYPGDKISIDCENLQSIESKALYKLNRLKELHITGNPRIDLNAMLSCAFIQKIDLPNYRGEFDFNDTTLHELSVVNIPYVTSIDRGFKGNRFIKNITAGSLSCINRESFKDSSIQTLCAQRLKQIGKSAFENCRNLSVIQANAIEYIGQRAFYNCGSLLMNEGNSFDDLVLSRITCIEDYAFYGCSSMTAVYFASVSSIGVGAFGCCAGIRQANFQDVKLIDSGAFAKCESLSSIYMPNIYKLGEMAFSGCSSLKFVNLPYRIDGADDLSDYIYPSIYNPSDTTYRTIRYGRSAFAGCDIDVYMNGFNERDALSAVCPYDYYVGSVSVPFNIDKYYNDAKSNKTLFGSDAIRVHNGKLKAGTAVDTSGFRYVKLNNGNTVYLPYMERYEDFTNEQFKYVDMVYTDEWIYSDGVDHKLQLSPMNIWVTDDDYTIIGDIITVHDYRALQLNLEKDGHHVIAYRKYIDNHYETASGKYIGEWSDWSWNDDSTTYGVEKNEYDNSWQIYINPDGNGRSDGILFPTCYPNTENPNILYAWNENTQQYVVLWRYLNCETPQEIITNKEVNQKLNNNGTLILGKRYTYSYYDGETILADPVIDGGAFSYQDIGKIWLSENVKLNQQSFVSCNIYSLNALDDLTVHQSFKDCRIENCRITGKNLLSSAFWNCDFIEPVQAYNVRNFSQKIYKQNPKMKGILISNDVNMTINDGLVLNSNRTRLDGIPLELESISCNLVLSVLEDLNYLSNCQASSVSLPWINNIPPNFMCHNQNLRELDISHVKELKYSAFYNCQNLSSIKLSSYPCLSNTKGVFTNTALDISAKNSGNYFIINNILFSDYTQNGELSIDGLKVIHSVRGNTALEKIACKNVLSIYSSIQNIKHVDLSNVEYISKSCFENYGLSALSMPNVKHIDNRAFSKCSLSIAELRLDSLETMRMQAFASSETANQVKSQLKYFSAPRLSVLEDNVFGGRKSLISVDLPAVVSAFDHCFAGCSRMQNIYLPNASYIGKCAFQTDTWSGPANYLGYNYTQLSSISLPKAEYAFQSSFRYNFKLAELNIPRMQTINSDISCPTSYSTQYSGSKPYPNLKRIILSDIVDMPDIDFEYFKSGNQVSVYVNETLYGKIQEKDYNDYIFVRI